MTGRDSIETISAFVADGQTLDLPGSVVEATAASIADTMACMTAGSRSATVEAVLRVASRWGGAPTCRIVGHDERLPAYLAALVNASMAHQHDFDDTHDAAVCHPTSASLTAALATADEFGDVDGATFVRAVAIGNDIACRLGLAIDGTLWDFPWTRAPVVGMFGAVAASAVVAGLDEATTRHAFGLALPQVGSTLESVMGAESDVRSMRDGLAYKDAMLAVCLAAEGVRGDERVLDGPYGLFASFFEGRYDAKVVTRDLGDWFPGSDLSLKPWPTCRHTQATLTALIGALDELGAEAEAIKRIDVRVGSGNERLTSKPWPTIPIDATCNLEYAVSVAATNGDFELDALRPERLNDSLVKEMSRRIRWLPDADQDRYGTIEPGDVTVLLTDGRETRRRVDHSLGHPDAPMPRERRARKLVSCAAHARMTWSEDSALGYLDRIDHLWSAASSADVWALPPG